MDMLNVKINGISVSVEKALPYWTPRELRALKFPHFAL